MHAEEMAKEFCKRGIKSVAVYSNADGEFSEERNQAIEQLKNQEIKVIFSVDMFNEGVDIASLDMVMFLRPTESPTVFLQQLGRGLRISKGKEYVNVLDFIGNYEKAGRAPFLLNGGACIGERTAYDYSEIEYPDDCIVDFDMRLIDLFREMDKKSWSIQERIKQEYYRVKELLDGKVPTRMELFTNMDDNIYEYCMKHSKENPFKRYMDFLYEIHELLHLNFNDKFGTYRIFLWKRTLKLVKDYPLIGTGPDTFALRFMAKYTEDIKAIGPLTINDTAANVYLTTLINLGVIGLSNYLLLMFSLLKKGLKEMNNYSKILLLAFICYLIQDFFNLSVVIVSPIFWLLMGVLYISLNADKLTCKKEIKTIYILHEIQQYQECSVIKTSKISKKYKIMYICGLFFA